MPLMSCWMKTSMPRPPRCDGIPSARQALAGGHRSGNGKRRRWKTRQPDNEARWNQGVGFALIARQTNGGNYGALCAALAARRANSDPASDLGLWRPALKHRLQHPAGDPAGQFGANGRYNEETAGAAASSFVCRPMIPTFEAV